MNMMGIGEEWKGKRALDWGIACIKGWGNEDMVMGIKTIREGGVEGKRFCVLLIYQDEVIDSWGRQAGK